MHGTMDTELLATCLVDFLDARLAAAGRLSERLLLAMAPSGTRVCRLQVSGVVVGVPRIC